MGEFGFISDKLEIKFLILYIAARVVGPVPFEVLQELSMCDGVEDGLYSITAKGRRNSAICETSLPYSVRMQAEQNLARCNEQLKRRALVGAELRAREEGGYELTLSLSDELDELMSLRLLITRQDMALDLQRRFREHAEEIYSKILADLYGGES